MKARDIIRRPLWTEKSIHLKEEANQVAFEVDRRANKIQIRSAIEEIFDVKVEKVRVINMRGKKKRTGRYVGRRPNWRRAYVTLAPGEKIDLLEGV